VKLVLAICLALTPALAAAKPLPSHGRFVYSNLCWEKDGDAVGSRFELLVTRQGTARLAYEYGNGPVASARITSLRLQGDKFEAIGSSADGGFNLSATLGNRRATLLRVFDDAKDRSPDKDVMKRIKRLDQKIPQCR
jgi:hypothetical protein